MLVACSPASRAVMPELRSKPGSGAGNNQSRALLTLMSRLSCCHVGKLMWHKGAVECNLEAVLDSWGEVVTPAQKRVTHAVCCQPLLGSTPELCLPCGTKKVWHLN